MRKGQRWVGLAVIAVLAGTMAAALLPKAPPATSTTAVRIGQAAFTATVVRDGPELLRGLSGSQPLGSNEAMLFAFPRNDTWGIWMKDMNYPIDIIWIDQQKVVQYIVADAQPASYPQTTFKPDRAVRYVLEVKAGTAAQKSITIGTRAEFNVAGN